MYLGLIIGPTTVNVAPSGRDASMWLSRTLTVALPKIDVRNQYRRGRKPLTEWGFYRYLDRQFPTGLLSFVVQAAAKDGVRLGITWEPGAAILPTMHDPADVWPAAFPARDYQLEIVREATRVGRGVMRASTGSGKTGMLAMILKCLGTPPSLVLVNAKTLVAQVRDEIARWIEAPVGEIAQGRRVLSPPVVVGLIHQVAAHAGEDWMKTFLAERRAIILDECHHVARSGRKNKQGRVASGMWYEVAMLCPAPNRYGVSATPLKVGDPVQNCRLIGATGPVFQNTVSSTELIQAGYGARPHIYFLKHNARRVPARSKYGDQLEPVPPGKKVRRVDRKVIRKGAYTLGIVESYERNVAVARAAADLYNLGLKVLLIVERREHGETLRGMLRSWKIACAYIHGGQDQLRQEERLRWLREPGPRVMVSTRVLGEGTDVPDLNAVVVARGGKAFVQLFQNIGRATRPKGDVENPGECIIVFLDDHHHKYFRKHVTLLRTYLASEPGFRVAEEGQTLDEYARAVLGIKDEGSSPVIPDQYSPKVEEE